MNLATLMNGSLGMAATRSQGGGAPTLSNFSAVSTGETTATLSLDTDTGNGTIYFILVTDGATAPNAAQVEAGTDGSDNAAVWAGSVVVSSIETWDVGPTGLTAGTTYDAYAVQKNASGNFSNVVSDEFSTDSAGILVTAWVNVGWDTWSSSGGSFDAAKTEAGGLDRCYSVDKFPCISGVSYEITIEIDAIPSGAATMNTYLGFNENSRSTSALVPHIVGTHTVTVQATSTGNWSIALSTSQIGEVSVASARFAEIV